MKFLTCLLFLYSSLSYCQSKVDKRTVCLNADTSMNDVVFTIKGHPDAHTIYVRGLKWVSDYFGPRPNIILDTISDKMISIQANNPIIFFRPAESDIDEPIQYGENYLVEMNIENGIYFVKYIHQYFTQNGKKVELTLSDIINDVKNQPADVLPDTNQQFESNVGAFLLRIYDATSDPSFKF
jgi:hypothetical protein